MSEEERQSSRRAIRRAVLQRCAELRLPPGATVAAYQPLRTEPGSVELLAELTAAGYRVIVPHTLPDRDLDWLAWPLSTDEPLPPGGPAPAGGPVPAPAQAAPRLGLDAIAQASLVLVPAFAVDRTGHRLGRGGGSYDRALARVRPTAVVAALVFTSEVVDRVPVDAWDQPVTAAATPAGWLDLTPTGRGNS